MAASDTYPVGQCTYYVAERFPALYGYMGNAMQWVKSAAAHNYPVIYKPMPDTVAVFGPGNGYSAEGHVAVVDSVNGDGSYNVSEMNYAGWDQVDQRRVQPGSELGFIIPPGSQLAMPGAATGIPASYFTAGATGGDTCATRWNLPFGTSICMDGVIGGAAMAAGGALMLGGVLVIVALAVTGSKIGKSATSGVGRAAAPIGVAVRAQQQHTAKREAAVQQRKAAEKTAAADTHQQAMRRSQLRISRANARAAEARAKASKPRVVEAA